MLQSTFGNPSLGNDTIDRRFAVTKFCQAGNCGFADDVPRPFTLELLFAPHRSLWLIHMPVPEENGTLRIEGTPPQLLNIKIKK